MNKDIILHKFNCIYANKNTARLHTLQVDARNINTAQKKAVKYCERNNMMLGEYKGIEIIKRGIK